MANLLDATVKRLIHSVADTTAGNEVATNINQGAAVAAQSAMLLAGVIIATQVSTTTDFGSLQVGDRVVMIPAVAGNSQSFLVATAGTLPAAAVVNNTYLVFRAPALAAATAAVKI